MVKPADFSERETVRRRHFDPVDLTGAQRGQPRIRFGYRHQDDVVDLRHPRGVPVFVPARKIGLLPRHDLGDAGTARCRQPARSRPWPTPCPAFSNDVGRREQEVHRHIGEIGRRLGGGDGDGVVIDLLVAAHHGNARPRHRRTRRLKLWAVVVEIAIKIPDHGIGIEIGAVVEFHAAAQMEDPGLVVGRSPAPISPRARAARSPAGRSWSDPTAPDPSKIG